MACTVTSMQSCCARINSSKLAGTGLGTAPWRSRVMLLATHSGTESCVRLSLHQDAIAGSQFGRGVGTDIDGLVPILHKQRLFISAEVGDGGFKGTGRALPASALLRA